MKKRFSAQTLAAAGALVAMNIVLSRLVGIPIGPSLRITVSSVPIILAGLWFGPLVGGLCGFTGDLIGCFISGYAPNPFISVSAILMGVLPALFAGFLSKKRGEASRGASGFALLYIRMFLVIGLTMLITSQGITTYGLAVMYGRPFGAQWLLRLPQSILLLFVNSFLTSLLYGRVPQRLFAAGQRSRGVR